MIEPYYSEDGITLFCAKWEDILPQLTERVELLLSDPPWGVNLNTRTKTTKRGRNANKGFRGDMMAVDMPSIHNDDKPFEPAQFLNYPKVILWGGIHFANRLPNRARWIVWDKRCGSASDDNADCEFAWTNLRGQARIHSHYWRGWLRAGEENLSISGAKFHPAQKPVSLMTFCMILAGGDGTVLDPFAGSGTTLVAAKRLGRKAIGIEMSEDYCKIAVQRLSQMQLQFD